MEKYFSMSFKSISFVSYLVSCVLIAVGAVSEMLHIGLVYSPENMFLKKKKQTWWSVKMCSFSLKPLAAAAAKSLQSCPTLCDPIDSSPPGSPVPGILQKRTLEWVAISFSNAWKWKVKVKSLSSVRLFATP